MVIKSKTKAVNYDKFREYFQEKGLMYATKKSKGIKKYMICLARKIIPQKVRKIQYFQAFQRTISHSIRSQLCWLWAVPFSIPP